MASIEERLNRQVWDPKPGDILIGTIVKIKPGESQFAGHYPVLVIRDSTGAEWIVHCSRGGLKNPVVARGPKLGEQIGIRYVGTVQGRSQDAHRYNVEFGDDDESDVDWDRMRESRKRDNGNTSAAALAEDPWAGTGL